MTFSVCMRHACFTSTPHTHQMAKGSHIHQQTFKRKQVQGIKSVIAGATQGNLDNLVSFETCDKLPVSFVSWLSELGFYLSFGVTKY